MGIIGEIGSGKTTLVETILRLNFLKAKQIYIDKQDAAYIDIHEYRKLFSFAPQHAFLFSTSIRNNLLLATPWIKQDSQEEDDKLNADENHYSVDCHRLFSLKF